MTELSLAANSAASCPQPADSAAPTVDAPRLAPIDTPKGLILRLVYRASEKRYGRTPTAFRVLYARVPALLLVTLALALVLERFLRLPAQTRALVQFVVAKGHGCEFCADLSLAEALRAKLGDEKFRHFEAFETHPAFDDAERAAIAYARALTEDRRVPHHVFERLRRHFTEREVVEIVWLGGFESYFNAMAIPLRIGSDRLAALARQT
ncbi:MAG: carboxymuconolactone decarboxylase family protein [Polyangiaceae bacterium]